MTEQEEPIDKGAKLVNLILGGAALFCVVTLLYFIYFYAWTHERSFTSSVGPILYYILPATLASLFLLSFRLESSYRINLSLFLVSTCVSIYVVELWLTCFPSILSRLALDTPSIEKELGVAFDTRDTLSVIIDLEKQHINAVPSISPSLLLKKRTDSTLQSVMTINGKEMLPLGGIANKVTVFCNESGEYVMYESDEHGFHNPKGIWGTGHVDIAALGDSFTQGYCVPSHKNFVALIREHYPATLNLGIRGNGPLAELATLKEYGPSIKPKVALWFYFEGNDLVDLMREKGSPLLMAYLRDNFTQRLLPLQAEIDQALTTYVTAGRNAHTPKKWGEHEQADGGASRLLEELQAITKLTEVRQHLGLVTGRSSQDNLKGEMNLPLDLFGEILSQANAFVGVWGGRLYFVYLPAWARYANPASVNKYSDHVRYLASLRTRDSVLAFVRTLGLPIIDIHEVFQAHSDPLALFPFHQRLHYNKEGNHLIAEEVLRAIFLADLKPTFKGL